MKGLRYYACLTALFALVSGYVFFAGCGGGDGGGGSSRSGVALLANNLYVDYIPGNSSSEASNLEAALKAQRHAVDTFTDVTADGIRGAVERKAVLVIPEMENGSLNPDLDDAARGAIASFVKGGGTLLMFFPSDEVIDLLNNTFGYSLVEGYDGGTISRNAAGTVGTPFEKCGPAEIGSNNATTGLTEASLPAGSKRIYTDATGDSLVTLIPAGSGKIVILGWDWYDATPTGTQDFGWWALLYRSARLKDKFPDVGVVHAIDNAFADDILAKLKGSCQFDDVTLVNALTSTPSSSTLDRFDAVLVTSDDSFDNAVTLGNRLADYMDRGGGVVLSVFSFNVSPPAGRFQTDDYFVIPSGSGQTDGIQETGDFLIPGHPILAGVMSFDGGTASYQPNTSSVTAGSIRVANWSDGSTPLVATRTIGEARRADLGFYAPSSDARSDFWDASTDGDKIMANALTWTAKAK